MICFGEIGETLCWHKTASVVFTHNNLFYISTISDIKKLFSIFGIATFLNLKVSRIRFCKRLIINIPEVTITSHMENICTKTYFSSIFLSTSRVASLSCTSCITGPSRFEKKSKYLKSNFPFFPKSPYLNIKEF